MKQLSHITYGGKYYSLEQDEQLRRLGSKVGGSASLQVPGAIPNCRVCSSRLRFLAQVVWPKEASFPEYKGAVVFVCPATECLESHAITDVSAIVFIRNLALNKEQTSEIDPSYALDWERVRDHPKAIEDFTLSELEDYEWLKTFGQLYGDNKLFGWPHWIQNPEYPTCPVCGGETEFLCQFGFLLEARSEAEGGNVLLLERNWVGFIMICLKRCSDRGGVFLWQCD